MEAGADLLAALAASLADPGHGWQVTAVVQNARDRLSVDAEGAVAIETVTEQVVQLMTTARRGVVESFHGSVQLSWMGTRGQDGGLEAVRIIMMGADFTVPVGHGLNGRVAAMAAAWMEARRDQLLAVLTQ